MNKTLKTINGRIAKYDFVNPNIPTQDKVFLVIKNSDRVNVELFRSDSTYRSAVEMKIESESESPSEGDALSLWLDGMYESATIASLAREWREFNS